MNSGIRQIKPGDGTTMSPNNVLDAWAKIVETDPGFQAFAFVTNKNADSSGFPDRQSADD